MLEESLKHLTHQGIQAVQAAGKIGAKATDEIVKLATHPALKEALHRGHAQAQIWTDRLTRVQEMVHGTSGDGDNPIIRAHQEVAHKIANHAKDPVERDLGLIAAGQLALHYYIGAFGTLAAYTHQAGHAEAASLLKQCADEAKQHDEEHTRLAQQMMSETK